MGMRTMRFGYRLYLRENNGNRNSGFKHENIYLLESDVIACYYWDKKVIIIVGVKKCFEHYVGNMWSRG